MMRFRDRFDPAKRKKSTLRQRQGLALFWLLVVCYAYFIPMGPNWNADSRLYTTFAIVDHHTLTIDAYRQRLGDISFARGHYYSDKAPGLSLLAVVPYIGLHMVLPGLRGRGYDSYSRMRFSIKRDTVYIRYAITY